MSPERTTFTGQAAREQFEPGTASIMPADEVTRVALLRHGEVRAFADRVVRGQLDTPLSARGEEQSRTLAAWFASSELAPDALWSSDLSRCRVLAELLREETGCAPIYDARLREQSMGAWQGRTWEEITREDGPRVTAYWDDYVDAAPPEGESLRQVQARVLDWWDEALERHRGGNLVVATHIGVIRSLLCAQLGIPLGDALRLSPAVGSHTSLLVSEAGTVLGCFGERPWAWSGSDARAEGGSARRIALSGSAGTGKTTLGRALAEHLGVPFIEEGMRTRLEQGLDVHALGPDGWRALIRELWTEQREAEDAAGEGYVVDRSSLDYAAFWLHYNLWEEREATEAFLADMQRAASRYDRVFLFPWGALPLESDGIRAANRWLQLRYQTILEGLLDRYAPAEAVTRVPAVEEFEVRLAAALAACG